MLKERSLAVKVRRQKMLKTVNKKNKFKSEYDNLGSYTGTDYEDVNSKPVQDADDL